MEQSSGHTVHRSVIREVSPSQSGHVCTLATEQKPDFWEALGPGERRLRCGVRWLCGGMDGREPEGREKQGSEGRPWRTPERLDQQ